MAEGSNYEHSNENAYVHSFQQQEGEETYQQEENKQE